MFTYRGSSRVVLLWILSYITVTAAYPTPLPLEILSGKETSPNPHHIFRRAIGNGVTLRIMVLGASISSGSESSVDYEKTRQTNGYRYALRSALRAQGNAVNMVGSQEHGSMQDKQNEGYPGYTIERVQSAANSSLHSQRPNVVMILVGSNDAILNIDSGNMHNRMMTLIDHIYSIIPDTTVLLAKLSMHMNPEVDARIVAMNSKLDALIEARRRAGKNVYTVDMHSSWFTIEDFPDGLHPNAAANIKFATVFYNGLLRASSGIRPPADPTPGPDDDPSSWGKIINDCDKIPGHALAPVKFMTGASAAHDGSYIHKINTGSRSVFIQGTSTGGSRNGTRFANVVRPGRHDHAWIEPGATVMILSENTNSGGASGVTSYTKSKYTVDLKSQGFSCPNRANVRFADFNGNGLDDLVCIHDNGAMQVYINQSQGGTVKFKSPNGVFAMGAQVGCPRERILLGDVDGDGRVDYMCITDDLVIRGWRNNGKGPLPSAWEPMGTVFDGSSVKSKYDRAGFRMIDLNGDGRDDLLWVSPKGAVTTWINQRGSAPGSLRPKWMPAVVTHTGAAGATRDNVMFGKIWSVQNYNTDPTTYLNADYVYGADVDSKYLAVQNIGTGGRKIKGDGVRFCDMTGNGRDDYIYVYANGRMIFHGNDDGHIPPQWMSYSDDLWNPSVARSRREIHLADWDGDGRCDILYVDKADGRITFHKNLGRPHGKWAFGAPQVIAGPSCTQGYGTSLHDLGVQFADMTGNKYADYLCVDPVGEVTGWFNSKEGLTKVPLRIKGGVGADRQNIRFADINGDGRADYLWVDKFTGKTRAWYNLGVMEMGGSNIGYRHIAPMVVAMGGSVRGENVYFAKIGKIGRADYIHIHPDTGVGHVHYNVCKGSGGELTPPPPLPNDPTLAKRDNNLPDGAKCHDLIADYYYQGEELWHLIGGTAKLDEIIAENGANAAAIDMQVYNENSDANAILECWDLVSGRCQVPPTTCPANVEDFTTFFIQTAFAQLNAKLRFVKDVYRDAISEASNSIPEMVGIFAIAPGQVAVSTKWDDTYFRVATSLSVLSFLVYGAGGVPIYEDYGGAQVASVIGLTGNIITFLGYEMQPDEPTPPPFQPDLNIALTSQLAYTAKRIDGALRTLASSIFLTGRVDNSVASAFQNHNPNPLYPQEQPIYSLTNVFAHGKWMEAQHPIDQAKWKSSLSLTMKKALISIILASNGFYILRGRFGKEECYVFDGILLGDYVCHTLERPGEKKARSDDYYSIPVSREYLANLGRYGITLKEIVEESDRCQALTNRYHGTRKRDSAEFNMKESDPCFYNLPLIDLTAIDPYNNRDRSTWRQIRSPCRLRDEVQSRNPIIQDTAWPPTLGKSGLPPTFEAIFTMEFCALAPYPLLSKRLDTDVGNTALALRT